MSSNDKTIFSTSNRDKSLEEMILLEIIKRGGTAKTGSNRKPGEDRKLFGDIARYFGITEAQQQETNSRGRNKWDYTIFVAVQRLKDPARAGKTKDPNMSLIAPSRRGVWELTEIGRTTAARLSSGA